MGMTNPFKELLFNVNSRKLKAVILKTEFSSSIQ